MEIFTRFLHFINSLFFTTIICSSPSLVKLLHLLFFIPLSVATRAHFKMDALKRLASRARQKSAEIILSAEKTEIGAELEGLLTKTDKTEEHMKKLVHAIEVYLQPNPAVRALDPRKDKSGRQNTLDGLGEAMKEAASKAVGAESTFGAILLKVSQTESKMAAGERQLIQSITTQTLASLRHLLENELRTVQKERSVLNKKRLDLDATKSRWKRASDDKKPAVEAELRKAQDEFDTQLETISTALEAFQTAVDRQAEQLVQFVAAQIEYHSTSLKLLKDLKRDLGAYWICNDVWMDILPSFDRPKLGLNLALLSFRFDALVDKHFDGKTTQLTIWREITIGKDKGSKPKVSVPIDGNLVEFPLPDHPLPNKIRFNYLWIDYIDHSVLTFLHSNKQIWDRSGTKLELIITNGHSIWDVFTREIWPIFTTSIRHLNFGHGRDHLDNLRRHISPTILTDLDQLNSITYDDLLPDVIADDGPNETSAGQALTKWLHTPTKNGQSKRLRCDNYSSNLEWIDYFKETFRRATTSVRYKIRFVTRKTIMPFELVNERTNEKVTLTKDGPIYWLLKRCQIIRETAATDQKQQKKDDNLEQLNRVFIHIFYKNSIGLLFPPDQSDEKNFPWPSDQRNKKK
ncbi:hypothetical protein niasHT_013350 [Heterodera trifolii]|uniref:BAR domain-containing protein n=1 Tax=Heterodera trifolii TaxID=157864 RepID=A0ABD2L7U1_9BILA